MASKWWRESVNPNQSDLKDQILPIPFTAVLAKNIYEFVKNSLRKINEDDTMV